jgi:RNA polymerase sigma-70 factor (ECF subfamily)
MELPIKYQEVMALRFFEKQSIKDIALITDKNTNTVKSLLARGTDKLKQNFAESKKA